MNNMPSEQQIAEAIESVLRRREFWGTDAGFAPNDTVSSLGRAFLAGLETLGGFGFFVMILIAAAMLFLLAWLIYSERRYRLGRREKRRSLECSVAADPLLHAQALALKQDWAGALLALYALHLQTLHQHGWIVLDQSKTGMQYQWELKGRGYDDVAGFDAFRKVFNRVRYGGYCELKETYEIFLAYCSKRRQTV